MEISFWKGELVLALIWLEIRFIVWLIHRGKIEWKREAVLLLMYVNLAVILRVTFFPLEHVDGHIAPLVYDPENVYPFRLNLVPWKYAFKYMRRHELRWNMIGNVLLFVPTGILMPLIYPKMNRFWKVFLAGMGLSLTIELMQLPFASRVTDVDDLILNTVGAAAGYILYWIVRTICRAVKRKRVREESV